MCLPNSGLKHLYCCAWATEGDVVQDELHCPDELTLVTHHLHTRGMGGGGGGKEELACHNVYINTRGRKGFIVIGTVRSMLQEVSN